MAENDEQPERSRATATLLIAGSAALVVGSWLTRHHVRPFSDYWYSVVWTGFILAADGAVAWRTGRSLALDRPRELGVMVLVSAALWWAFEAANSVLLDSWSYTPSPDVPQWAQRARSTYAFATLVPATWEAMLLALLVTRLRAVSSVAPRWVAWAAIASGLLAGGLVVPFRALALPLGLVALGLVTDATNLLRGRTSLLAQLYGGAWGVPLAICAGNVAAGVLGEAWNATADPKWTYRVPYADVWKLFEMPWPGYLGYAALALDLFALHHAVRPSRPSSLPLPPEHPLSLTGIT